MTTQMSASRLQILRDRELRRPRPFLRWLDRLLDTPSDLHLAACRIILGGVMFAHGAQKALGWWGGQGVTASIHGFQQHLGLPPMVGLMVVVAELGGAVGLILGFFGRIASLSIIAVMIGAIFLVHLRFGFFMNWFGTQPGEGFEYHLLAIGLALPVLAKGSGALSADDILVRALRNSRSLSD